jgi:hypothetical protein
MKKIALALGLILSAQAGLITQGGDAPEGAKK